MEEGNSSSMCSEFFKESVIDQIFSRIKKKTKYSVIV